MLSALTLVADILGIDTGDAGARNSAGVSGAWAPTLGKEGRWLIGDAGALRFFR